MVLIGLTAGIVIAIISPPDFEWNALGIAFTCVFLVGLISLAVTGIMRGRVANDVVNVLAGILVRTLLIGVLLIIVILTHRKSFAFYVLCFSILFYLGMISLNAWLVMPAQQNHHETDSSRGSS